MEDYYFLVKWKEEIVGILARINDTYYTRFQTKDLHDQKMADEIIKQTAFVPNVLYKDSKLFEFFMRRIKPNPGEDVFTRMQKTGAKRPTDNFSLQEMTSEQAQYCKGVIEEALELEAKNRRNNFQARG